MSSSDSKTADSTPVASKDNDKEQAKAAAAAPAESDALLGNGKEKATDAAASQEPDAVADVNDITKPSAMKKRHVTFDLGPSVDVDDNEVKVSVLKNDSDSNSAQMALTLGAGSINALTYRSFVDPQEARPDIATYDPNQTDRTRALFDDLNKDETLYKAPSSRHVLVELGDDDNGEGDANGVTSTGDAAPAEKERTKFGTWDGVFTSCLLNIFGVIMFLRVGWVVGQAGVPLALCIIGIACVVTVTTALSMSAIVTNGKIEAGGAYYMISRSIGPGIGGAIGFLFSLGQAVACAMYIIGFAETLVEQLFDTFTLTSSELNDTRVWGLILLGVIFIMVLIGVDWVIKLQLALLFLLCCSILSFFIGAFTTTDPDNSLRGISYFSETLSDNMSTAYQAEDGIDYDFFTVFAVFFPAVTGIMAGANISGDLQDPSESIPKGTLMSIAVSAVVYSAMTVLVGAAAQRAVGESDSVGLLYDTLIMVKISVVGPLVLIGIYAATFSSALASLVGAPRVLQMLALDGTVPFLKVFAKLRQSDGAPVLGYIFCAIVAGGCVCIGKLNSIAPLITMFFMITYAMINFACMALTLSKTPGWRPGFKYFTWWSSLLGGILCMTIMFIVSVVFTIIALIITALLVVYIWYQDVPTAWGSASEAYRDMRAVKIMMNLRTNKSHVKTYRPHYLVLTGHPAERPYLTRFMDTLSHGLGACIYGRVIIGDYKDVLVAPKNQTAMRSGYFVDDPSTGSGITGFMDTVISPDLYTGVHSLIQCCGLGRLRPNVLVLGFKEDWFEDDDNVTEQYVRIVRDALRMRLSCMIARNLDKLSFPGLPAANTTAPDSAVVSAASISGDGMMDVYWLVDDGGLCVLIPYILSLHTFWRQNTKGSTKVCNMRILMVIESGKNMGDLSKMVASMLANFRIKCEMELLEAGQTPPAASTIAAYEKFAHTSIELNDRPIVVKRWLRVAEVIALTSQRAALVACVLPFPSDSTHHKDFMALIAMLSSNMPPMVFIRGNDKNVLTFQSE